MFPEPRISYLGLASFGETASPRISGPRAGVKPPNRQWLRSGAGREENWLRSGRRRRGADWLRSGKPARGELETPRRSPALDGIPTRSVGTRVRRCDPQIYA